MNRNITEDDLKRLNSKLDKFTKENNLVIEKEKEIILALDKVVKLLTDNIKRKADTFTRENIKKTNSNYKTNNIPIKVESIIENVEDKKQDEIIQVLNDIKDNTKKAKIGRPKGSKNKPKESKIEVTDIIQKIKKPNIEVDINPKIKKGIQVQENKNKEVKKDSPNIPILTNEPVKKNKFIPYVDYDNVVNFDDLPLARNKKEDNKTLLKKEKKKDNFIFKKVKEKENKKAEIKSKKISRKEKINELKKEAIQNNKELPQISTALIEIKKDTKENIKEEKRGRKKKNKRELYYDETNMNVLVDKFIKNKLNDRDNQFINAITSRFSDIDLKPMSDSFKDIIINGKDKILKGINTGFRGIGSKGRNFLSNRVDLKKDFIDIIILAVMIMSHKVISIFEDFQEWWKNFDLKEFISQKWNSLQETLKKVFYDVRDFIGNSFKKLGLKIREIMINIDEGISRAFHKINPLKRGEFDSSKFDEAREQIEIERAEIDGISTKKANLESDTTSKILQETVENKGANNIDNSNTNNSNDTNTVINNVDNSQKSINSVDNNYFIETDIRNTANLGESI